MNLRDSNPGQGFKATREQLDWGKEDTYWRSNWQSRPYVVADRGYEFYGPGFRFGYESAILYSGRTFDDVESDLREQWDNYKHRGQATWEHIKEAARDGWKRVKSR
jgi:hypothetical protein